ncbi:MAG: hypothetical protein GC201_15700 [Alphaproteobacteria bacterium]|nr:hypothetical protein [Alphaproteobacteria bacterium]
MTTDSRIDRLKDLNVPALKVMVINEWRKAGPNTLVKVVPKERPLAVDAGAKAPLAAGYVTQIKFVTGASPAEMERRLGFGVSKYTGRTILFGGAIVYRLLRLPTAEEFDFRGYSQLPDGYSTSDQEYADVEEENRKMYPPGSGVPQWELCKGVGIPCKEIASLAYHEVFKYPTPTLEYGADG